MLFSVGFFYLYFGIMVVLLGFWLFRGKKKIHPKIDFPKVSILIAARNEEAHILTCLSAIDRLNYPKDKLEVLVGDDRSSDSTSSLVENLLPQRPYLRCIPIAHDVPGTKGKANVLAQLAKQATSGYFFITDADIEVPPTWVETMLAGLGHNTGIVTGITTTKGQKLFYRLQSLDWLLSLGLMQVIADQGLPVSCMGNNMLITRQAYEAVGGFAGIPFSVTEDVQILRQVLKKGFGSVNIYQPEVLAVSAPAPDFSTFLQQRRRWMHGSLLLPWYVVLLFMVYSAYYPVWLPFFWHAGWLPFVGIFLIKLGLQSIFVAISAKRAGWRTSFYEIFALEFYLLVTSLVLILYFFLPIKIKWKGRRY